LQIGKNQDDSSQDADYGYQFNNIDFIDDILIFAETPEEMQLINTWCRSSQRGVAWRSKLRTLSCSLLTRIGSEGKACWHQI